MPVQPLEERQQSFLSLSCDCESRLVPLAIPLRESQLLEVWGLQQAEGSVAEHQSLCWELNSKGKKRLFFFFFPRDQEEEDMCLEIREDKSIPFAEACDRDQDVHLPSQ